MTQRGIHFFKYKDFKKAVVYFKDSLQDVGMGMRVPELEEDAPPDYSMDEDDDDYSDSDGVLKPTK